MKTADVRTVELLTIVQKYGILVRGVDISQSFEEDLTKIKILVKIPENLDVGSLFAELRKIEGISKVNLKREM